MLNYQRVSHHLSMISPKKNPQLSHEIPVKNFTKIEHHKFPWVFIPNAPWCWNIYLQNWAIFRVHVGTYAIHGASGMKISSNPRYIMYPMKSYVKSRIFDRSAAAFAGRTVSSCAYGGRLKIPREAWRGGGWCYTSTIRKWKEWTVISTAI